MAKTTKFKVGDFVEIRPGSIFGGRARVVDIDETGVVVDPRGTGLGPYWGRAFGDKGLRKVKNLGKANDEGVPEDEMVLAALIQNAAARGLSSMKGHPYGKIVLGEVQTVGPGTTLVRHAVEFGMLRDQPPEGTQCVCALGAASLTPDTGLYVEGSDLWDVVSGNDRDDTAIGLYTGEDARLVNIGAAFEQALRPEGRRYEGHPADQS